MGPILVCLRPPPSSLLLSFASSIISVPPFVRPCRPSSVPGSSSESLLSSLDIVPSPASVHAPPLLSSAAPPAAATGYILHPRDSFPPAEPKPAARSPSSFCPHLLVFPSHDLPYIHESSSPSDVGPADVCIHFTRHKPSTLPPPPPDPLKTAPAYSVFDCRAFGRFSADPSNINLSPEFTSFKFSFGNLNSLHKVVGPSAPSFPLMYITQELS